MLCPTGRWKTDVQNPAVRTVQKRSDQLLRLQEVCPGPVHTEFFDRAGMLAVSKKEAFCAEPEAVVTQALTDSVHGRNISVYGAAMKGSRILSKILPDRLLVWGMMKINNTE